MRVGSQLSPRQTASRGETAPEGNAVNVNGIIISYCFQSPVHFPS
jgi:hypothetical protein